MKSSVLGERTIGKQRKDVVHEDLVRITLSQSRWVLIANSGHYTDVPFAAEASQQVTNIRQQRVTPNSLW